MKDYNLILPRSVIACMLYRAVAPRFPGPLLFFIYLFKTLNFFKIRSLFILLFKISRQGGNDLNSAQLGQTLSSYLCRRSGSAYMSIRHVDDLRKIKPVIIFMVDHFDAVGKDIVPSMHPMAEERPFVNSKKAAISHTAGYPSGSSLSVVLPNSLFGGIGDRGSEGIGSSSSVSRMPAALGSTVSPLDIPSDNDDLPSKHARFDNMSLYSRTASYTGKGEKKLTC